VLEVLSGIPVIEVAGRPALRGRQDWPSYPVSWFLHLF
jgi:hypothetical protein